MKINLRSPVFCANSVLTDEREFVACFSGNHINIESNYIARVVDCDKYRLMVLRNGETFHISNTCDEVSQLIRPNKASLWQRIKLVFKP